MSERPLVLALGHVGIELACRVPGSHDSGAPVEMDEISVQVAGNAAIAVATAAALGCRARLACKLGDDFIGHYVRAALSEFGIDTRCHVVESVQLSPLRFNAVSERNRRAVYTTRGDVDPIDPDDFDPDDLLDGVSALLVDGTSPAAQTRLAETAARRGIPVLVDGGHIREGMSTLVGLSDVLICSERLAADLALRDDLAASLVEIQRLGPRAVIITLGESGSIGLHGEELVRQASTPVDVIDTSGAGAVYHGAFATALLGDLPFAMCVAFASAAAALSCRRLGGFAGIPRREEVVSLLRTSAPGA